MKVFFGLLMLIENAINSDCQDLMDPCKEKLISFTPTKKIVALKRDETKDFEPFLIVTLLKFPHFQSERSGYSFMLIRPSFFRFKAS